VVAGDYASDDAILIATLFPTTGSQAAVNLPRQDAAIMAVTEINAVGIPGQDGAKRPLALVSCDIAVDRQRAIDHLIRLQVAGIVGPSSSSDVFALTELTAPSKVMMLTPTSFAASIVELGTPHALTRLMVPTDKQRIKMLQDQIAEVESQLKITRPGRPLKLAIYYRNDLTGQGTRDGLSNLVFNNVSLTDNLNNGTASSIGYDPVAAAASNWKDQPTVDRYVLGGGGAPAFRPDIVVMVGGVESVVGFFNVLEDSWQANLPSVPKPYWIVGDAAKQTAILTKIGGGATVNDNLRLRVRGTGLTTADPTALAAFNAYQQHFNEFWATRPTSSGAPYPATTPASIGMGPVYDAVYALAYGLAGARDPTDPQKLVRHPSGEDIANGMLLLSDAASATRIQLADKAGTVAAFRELAAGHSIHVTGTFGVLRWESTGAKSGGQVNIWCVSAPSTATVSSFKDSNVVFDVGSRTYLPPNPTGQYFTLIPPTDRGPPTPCAPLNPLPN
jgi:ABC-type branched-subunit amino acid transport system substrate-binding protein